MKRTLWCLLFLAVALVSAQEDCPCAKGTLQLFGYEKVTQDQQKNNCVGSCTEGDPFEIHSYTSTVQTLRVWFNGEAIQAIDVEFFNGNRTIVGNQPKGNPDAQITFAPGENLVDDFIISGTSDHASYLAFNTSQQGFAVGNLQTSFFFNSGNSFLCGFVGLADEDEIKQLGLILMKGIEAASVTNVEYPTLSHYNSGLAPQNYQSILCNDDSTQTQELISSFVTTTGESHTWSLSLSFTFGQSITITSGIPLIEEVSRTYFWSVGVSSTWSRTTNTTQLQNQTFKVEVPPRTIMNATFSWWDSGCTVPYTAHLNYNYTDKTNYTFHIEDKFSGSYITSVAGSYDSTELKSGQTCEDVRKMFGQQQPKKLSARSKLVVSDN